MVSIIMPVYNAERTLKAAVESVVNQSYNAIQIILVDDGSSDKSGAICDEFAARDSRISVIHKKNGGVSSARNSGIDTATGEYLLFIDSDDYLEPAAVGELLNLAESNAADMALGTVSTDMTGFCTYEGEPAVRVFEGAEVVEFAAKNIGNIYASANHAKLIKSSICGRFSNEYKIAEDIVFVFGCFERAARIAVTDREYYHYRQNTAGSITSVYSETKIGNYTAMYGFLKSWAEANSLPPELENEIDHYFIRMVINCMSCVHTSDRGFRYKIGQIKLICRNKTVEAAVGEWSPASKKNRIIRACISGKLYFAVYLMTLALKRKELARDRRAEQLLK